MVWRLDRLGRSLRHLVDVVAQLEQRQVAFHSLREAIDTATPAGKLQLHIFASLAEFERGVIREYPGNYHAYVALRRELQLTEARVFDKQQDRIKAEQAFIDRTPIRRVLQVG